MELAHKGIREEEIAESAPLVRALVVERLEMVWAACEPQIRGTTGKPDPRFIEAGLRALKQLSDHYRLAQPAPSTQIEGEGPVSSRELVSNGLRELENRLQDVVQG